MGYVSVCYQKDSSYKSSLSLHHVSACESLQRNSKQGIKQNVPEYQLLMGLEWLVDSSSPTITYVAGRTGTYDDPLLSLPFTVSNPWPPSSLLRLLWALRIWYEDQLNFGLIPRFTSARSISQCFYKAEGTSSGSSHQYHITLTRLP